MKKQHLFYLLFALFGLQACGPDIEEAIINANTSACDCYAHFNGFDRMSGYSGVVWRGNAGGGLDRLKSKEELICIEKYWDGDVEDISNRHHNSFYYQMRDKTEIECDIDKEIDKEDEESVLEQ